MTLIARRLSQAEEDIFGAALYLNEYSESVADRFFDAVDKTVAMLCEHPELGEVFRVGAIGTMRHRTITDFPNYVIFYRHNETELLVIRVLHGSQDYPNVFNK